MPRFSIISTIVLLSVLTAVCKTEPLPKFWWEQAKVSLETLQP